jgi:ribokinase
MTADVVLAGQLARDLVLVMEDVPEPGQSRPVRERREMLGGKGANQPVAVAQLGAASRPDRGRRRRRGRLPSAGAGQA